MRAPHVVRELLLPVLAAFTLSGGGHAFAQEKARPSPTPTASVSEPPSETAAPNDDETPSATSDDDRDEKPRRRHGRRNKGSVTMGSGLTVATGETHDDDIVVMGGPVEIAGRQKGDVVVMGGPITVSGTVEGDVVGIGGPVHLKSTARVEGDAVSIGAGLQRDEGAVVEGQAVGMAGGNMLHFLPDFNWPEWSLGKLFVISIVEWIWTAVVTLLLTIVIAAVMPGRIEATAVALRDEWLTCFAWGFLAFLASLALTAVLCITCVGAIVPYLFYKVAKYYGLAALFVVVGQALGRNGFKRDLTLLPSLLLGFLILSLLALFVPAVWWIYSWFAVGAALFTRFGTMRPWFPPRPPAPNVPPPPSTLEPRESSF